MLRYLAHRLFQTAIVLLGVTVVVFVVLRIMPGDPVALLFSGEDSPSPEEVRAYAARLGLDKPLPIQYAIFVGGLVRLDFGSSIWQHRPVRELINDALPLTIELSIAGLLVAAIIAVPIAVLSALRQNSVWDRAGTALALFGLSMPSFWQGILLILLLAVMVPIFPVSGVIDTGMRVEDITGLPMLDALLTGNWPAFGSLFMHLALPAITLGTGIAAGLTRVLRSSLLEVKHQDFVDALRARGLPERTVVRRMLRNALPTTIIVFGMRLGHLLGGTLVIETVFSYPGMGWLLIQSINQRDFPVVQAAVIVITLLVVASNFLADLAHGLLDPRVHLAGKRA